MVRPLLRPARLTHWTLLVPRFDAADQIPLVDERGAERLVCRAELHDAVTSGRPVYSVSGYLLASDHIDAGRLL